MLRKSFVKKQREKVSFSHIITFQEGRVDSRFEGLPLLPFVSLTLT
jgi:hypothetical protein